MGPIGIVLTVPTPTPTPALDLDLDLDQATRSATSCYRPLYTLIHPLAFSHSSFCWGAKMSPFGT